MVGGSFLACWRVFPVDLGGFARCRVCVETESAEQGVLEKYPPHKTEYAVLGKCMVLSDTLPNIYVPTHQVRLLRTQTFITTRAPPRLQSVQSKQATNGINPHGREWPAENSPDLTVIKLTWCSRIGHICMESIG